MLQLETALMPLPFLPAPATEAAAQEHLPAGEELNQHWEARSYVPTASASLPLPPPPSCSAGAAGTCPTLAGFPTSWKLRLPCSHRVRVGGRQQGKVVAMWAQLPGAWPSAAPCCSVAPNFKN